MLTLTVPCVPAGTPVTAHLDWLPVGRHTGNRPRVPQPKAITGVQAGTPVTAFHWSCQLGFSTLTVSPILKLSFVCPFVLFSWAGLNFVR